MGAATGRPLIGITSWLTTARWSNCNGRVSLVEHEFVEKIEQAGGRALIVPPDARSDDPVVEVLDGVVLTGGYDVDPARYDAERGEHTVPEEPLRDDGELAIARAALARDLPLLGICRGCQVLNVVRGGTLVQHVPERYPAGRHARGGDPAAPVEFVDHAVSSVPDTPFERLLGERYDVKSGHHQAVDRLGEGVAVGARSDDGLVEAIYLPSARFALGVQWHPEVTDDAPELFAALVSHAGEPAAATTPPRLEPGEAPQSA